MVRKALYDIKSVWKSLLVAAVLCWLLLPVINVYQMKDVPLELSVGNVLLQAQLFLPAAVAFPCGLLMKQTFEEGVSELTHTLPLIRKTGPGAILLFQFLCQVLPVPVFLWYAHYYGLFLWQELLRTVIQGFFLQNIAYAAAYLTHIPIAGIASQILSVGVMQMALLNPNYEELFLFRITIYARITEFAPRPWNPVQLVLVAVVGSAFYIVGARRTRRYFPA